MAQPLCRISSFIVSSSFMFSLSFFCSHEQFYIPVAAFPILAFHDKSTPKAIAKKKGYPLFLFFPFAEAQTQQYSIFVCSIPTYLFCPLPPFPHALRHSHTPPHDSTTHSTPLATFPSLRA